MYKSSIDKTRKKNEIKGEEKNGMGVGEEEPIKKREYR